MKFKKPRGVLLTLGIVAFVIAAVLFFLVPVICADAFKYNALSVVVEGAKALFTFNFINVLYTALFILFICAVACVAIYIAISIKKKHGLHLLSALFTLVLIFGSYLVVSVYFLADIEFNGSTGKLLNLILSVDGAVLGKILSSLVLAFAAISNVLLIVHLFIALVAMFVTQQMKDYEKKCKDEAQQTIDERTQTAIEEKMAEQVFVQPVASVQEKAPEAIASEPIVTMVTAKESTDTTTTTITEKPESEEDFEARKQKETRLFKECLDSGYFTEYEEIELPEPLEGIDEEPVCELSVVEEKSSLISRRSVHVGYTHE